jgi:hypothetical protein
MGRRGCPAEFRRRVLDLVEAGRPVAEVAQDLGITPARGAPAPPPSQPPPPTAEARSVANPTPPDAPPAHITAPQTTHRNAHRLTTDGLLSRSSIERLQARRSIDTGAQPRRSRCPRTLSRVEDRPIPKVPFRAPITRTRTSSGAHAGVHRSVVMRCRARPRSAARRARDQRCGLVWRLRPARRPY